MPTLESVGFTALDEKHLQEFGAKRTATVAISKASVTGGWTKRIFDLCLATCGLIGLLPLFALVALAVKVSSTGPVLYGHIRVGNGGRSFRCWKFRTMVTNGDAVLESYLADHPDEKVEWEQNRKLRDDPRVTRIGSVMRAYSVDELPQLINVIRGDMSLVGPRPVVQDELDIYGSAAPHYLRSRPGLTGLWQISGRSDTTYDERIAFDTSYVQRWSFSQDLLIIARTVPAVLLSKGSY